MMLRRFLRRCSSRGSNNTLRVDCHYRLPQILQLKYYNRTITSSRILFCSNRDINTNSTNCGAAIGRDIYALAGVGDADNIIRHLLKLPIADIDKIIIKTIEIMENNGLYESISRYIGMLISKNLLLNRVIFNAPTDLPFNGYFISNVWLKVANTLVESPLLDDSLHLIEVMCKRNIYPTSNVLEKVIQKVTSLEDSFKLLNILIDSRYNIPISLYNKIINLICDKCMSNIIGRHTDTAINESIELMQASIAILQLMDERTMGAKSIAYDKVISLCQYFNDISNIRIVYSMLKRRGKPKVNSEILDELRLGSVDTALKLYKQYLKEGIRAVISDDLLTKLCIAVVDSGQYQEYNSILNQIIHESNGSLYSWCKIIQVNSNVVDYLKGKDIVNAVGSSDQLVINMLNNDGDPHIHVFKALLGIKTNLKNMSSQVSSATSPDHVWSHLAQLDKEEVLQRTVPFIAAMFTLRELSVNQKGTNELIVKYFQSNIEQAISNTKLFMVDNIWPIEPGNTYCLSRLPPHALQRLWLQGLVSFTLAVADPQVTTPLLAKYFSPITVEAVGLVAHITGLSEKARQQQASNLFQSIKSFKNSNQLFNMIDPLNMIFKSSFESSVVEKFHKENLSVEKDTKNDFINLKNQVISNFNYINGFGMTWNTAATLARAASKHDNIYKSCFKDLVSNLVSKNRPGVRQTANSEAIPVINIASTYTCIDRFVREENAGILCRKIYALSEYYTSNMTATSYVDIFDSNTNKGRHGRGGDTMSDVLSLHKTVQLLDSMCQLHSIDADTERNDLLQECAFVYLRALKCLYHIHSIDNRKYADRYLTLGKYCNSLFSKIGTNMSKPYNPKVFHQYIDHLSMNAYVQPKSLNPAIRNTGESNVDDYNSLLLINLYDTSINMPAIGVDQSNYPSVDMSIVTRHLIERVASDPDANLGKILNLILKITNIFAANMRHDLTVDLVQSLTVKSNNNLSYILLCNPSIWNVYLNSARNMYKSKLYYKKNIKIDVEGVIESASSQRCFLNLEFVSKLLELTNENNYVYAWMQSLVSCISHDINHYAEVDTLKEYCKNDDKYMKIIEKFVKINR